MPIDAHVTRAEDRLIFAVRTPDAATREDAGGRAIATLFRDDTATHKVDHEKVALAWVAGWAEAQRGVVAVPITLPGGDVDVETNPLAGLADDMRTAMAWRKRANSKGKNTGTPVADVESGNSAADHNEARPQGEVQAPVALRFLKDLDELEIGDIRIDRDKQAPLRRRKARTGLVDAANLSDPSNRVPSGSLPTAYTEADRERLAVAVLRRLLETNTRTLRDLRHVGRLGADVVDNLGKYFEIKASAGEMPDVIRLQYSELERSLERPAGHWFLVVVAGLERGYETKVRFILDPLRTLKWSDTGTITLSGVRTAEALEVLLPQVAITT
jgi:hypothetical protein